MSSKSQPTLPKPHYTNINCNPIEDQEDPEISNSVTTHLYLKPAHTTQTLDREVVLRRIRNRKRVNKIKAALLSLFGSPISSETEKTSVDKKRWVDDAFAAL
ncbi:hypothetical protein HS088_TW11G00807 [Tripterygium wilfordii]|uniref:Uncharacterized protein n=1 Tax=Tripterygium wilfordii TaxID=458696 RepID=A0A7J7D397_TRIWF|nr:hypothetical protein HS088_TW11G00807 [Tripterygium wilfordii]